MGICLSLLAVMSLKYLSNQTKSPATSASIEANSEDLYMSMSSQVNRISRTRQKKEIQQALKYQPLHLDRLDPAFLLVLHHHMFWNGFYNFCFQNPSENTDSDQLHCYYMYVDDQSLLKRRLSHDVVQFLKWVGYMAARIVDEGETVVLLTGRVHKDYEGKSYIDVLGRYLGSLAVQQGVTLILSVKKSSEFLEMPIVTERYKHLYNVNCFAFLLDPGSITLQNNDIRLAGSLHNLSYGRLSSNLQLEETRKYLAPNGRLFIQVVPLKVEKDNTEHIIGHDDSTVTYYDVMVENGTHRGLMSRGILYKTAENASFQNVYLLDIVGSDMRSIQKHLVKHVLRIKQNAQGKTKLFICSSEDFDQSSLLTSINDSGMDKWCLESQRSSFVFGIVEVFNAFKSKY